MTGKKKVLNEELWDLHLSRQFSWTRKLREKVYNWIDIGRARNILDAGCGIGLISRELGEKSGGSVTGVDINEKLLERAKKNYPHGVFLQGSLEALPLEDDTFDVSFCHFVLMWMKKPKKAMEELKRVTKPGGFVVCCAEPDYGAKIDYPDPFNMAYSSIQAIRSEGADPFMGRKLKSIFSTCGLKPHMEVHTDLWDDETMLSEFEHTWKFQKLTAENQSALNFCKTLEDQDRAAIKKGERVTLLPVFWGAAVKPAEETPSPE